ncbi:MULTISPECIES: fructose-1,6-bisphosphate aldolase/phosphatase [Metallosphaera]|uniref:Fructose-1,6-bisphosphate aldolase/phosphatase n=3 Tax=Metallosphaera TaxID=41980 RepID=FBPAP_METS5|nr:MULTISPECIES: fructose-1,6-bisphosphate aldolase/phosphatase [Metallosphaera]A4YIZ5.1 RecName: Full=Fructose-1,6-bisphosphate aldolase/phosphatase; Short=FBP A/P; Short=FBP aldolase/phosphatase [Metallosphaera sedula DSM 5348]ABP96397.1 fructose-bisphosphate aldolase / D-fructose 1,6-bisphosphatase [Metallosphaera sedula DSM 5348]AIM28380.1 fructose-bisphosphate aldolase / D-fructose 1,6-bisphosphatase [Metallosphaera sedula]AKV75171.1 fructose 1,6-bisphosphatase [Metallosphaera sedula]AKV7
MRSTVSVIKADIGSLAGHHVVHPDTMAAANRVLAEAKRQGIILDYYITNVGDDLELIMSHTRGELDTKVHETAWDAFKEATKVSKELGLYAAGQDLLSDSFSGNLKGMGPGIAELDIEERPSEPIAIFMADKTEPGAFNLPLYKMFADPFNTAGLVIDPTMNEGFKFEVLDVYEGQSVVLNSPEEMYSLLGLIGTPARYVIRRVYRKADNMIGSVTSIERLNLIAGKYVGKDDPVLIVRLQHGFPALGEALEAFSFPYLVPGWMRGSHYGPIMPVSQRDAKATRFDGPPRLIGLGFNVKNGKLTGPSDLFDDPAFDETRRMASVITDYMRRHGPFMPHRLEPTEMEYTTLPTLIEKLKPRFKKEEDVKKAKPSVYTSKDQGMD